MNRMEKILKLEELSNAALPSLETVLYDGWVLRFSQGLSQRANSVHPLYGSTRPIAEKIDACERLFAERGLQPVFKLSPPVHPHDLDRILEEQGYALGEKVMVEIREDLHDIPVKDAESAEDERANAWISFRIREEWDPEWFAGSCRLNRLNRREMRIKEKMLKNIAARTAQVSAWLDGKLAACGLGVLQDGYIGLYDVVTDSRYRRKGLGHAMIGELLAWGRKQGAKTAYLQVLENNGAALNLYRKWGFRPFYSFHFRIKRV